MVEINLYSEGFLITPGDSPSQTFHHSYMLTAHYKCLKGSDHHRNFKLPGNKRHNQRKARNPKQNYKNMLGKNAVIIDSTTLMTSSRRTASFLLVQMHPLKCIQTH